MGNALECLNRDPCGHRKGGGFANQRPDGARQEDRPLGKLSKLLSLIANRTHASSSPPTAPPWKMSWTITPARSSRTISTGVWGPQSRLFPHLFQRSRGWQRQEEVLRAVAWVSLWRMQW